jgi:hypothetical protein
VEVTFLSKQGGPLTKRIALGPDGGIESDGSQCVMWRGRARRAVFAGVEEFARAIGELGANEALALGALRADLPDEVSVVTKRRLNGALASDIIARTQDYISHRPGTEGPVLLDFDVKGMPPAVAIELGKRDGFWPALVSAVPGLANAARVERASTSAGLYDRRTRKKFAGSGGRHTYVLISDLADAERFVKTLHDRCWLNGLGWMMVGRAGQLLERSIVDRVCGSPERLAFEGCPVLVAPLAQEAAARQAVAVAGKAVDTLAACPPLGVVELSRLAQLHTQERYRLAGEAAAARESFIDEQSRRLVKRSGMPMHQARRTVERQCEGVLRPDTELAFDDPDLAGKTVADILVDPAGFEGETLADPLEGVEYGAGKAKIMRRADGSVWIHSFAHGRTVYELKNNFAAARAALEKTTSSQAPDELVRLVRSADLDAAEIEELRNLASAKTGISKYTMRQHVNNALAAADKQRLQAERDRRIAERNDPRPMVRVPAADAEYLPAMQTLNDAIGGDTAAEPPIRSANGVIALARQFRVPSLHALTSVETNPDDDTDEPDAGAGTTDIEAAQ